MSILLRQNRHNGASGDGGSHRRLLQICRRYVTNPFAVPLPAGLLPSHMVHPLLHNPRSSWHKSILGNAICYRLKALGRKHRRKITPIPLDQLHRDKLLHILDNDLVFRIRVKEARAVYKAYLRRCRDEKALREEAPSAPPTTPDRTQSNQDAPNQARTQMQAQYQSQPMVRTRTYRNPRQGASSGEAQTTTVVHGVTIHPPFPQTQSGPLPQTLYQPQIQPQQNVVANAHEGLPLHAANRDHRELLEFGHRNGWLIWRNIEIRGHHMLHERIIVAMFAIIIFLYRWRWQLSGTLLCILILFWLQHGRAAIHG